MTYVPTGQTGPLDWRVSGSSCVPTDNVTRSAFKALQTAIRNRGKKIAVDGVLGPNTLSALRSLGFRYSSCRSAAANTRNITSALKPVPFFGKLPTPSPSTDLAVTIGPAIIESMPKRPAAAIPGTARLPMGKPINWPMIAAVGGGGLLLLMLATQKKKPKRRRAPAAA